MPAVSTPQTLIDEIDAKLPQTQCTRCGYPRCRDYARAMAEGKADINRCPPGGDTTLHALSNLLHVPLKPLDPACGAHEPRLRAVIDEAVCIGCRKCIDACPVDAIVGARKLMHTVIASECNGCNLCVPPCPVDCIAMVPAEKTQTDISTNEPWPEYPLAEVARWRIRTEKRLERLARRAAKRATPAPQTERQRIRSEIQAAIERVRARRTPPKKN